MFSHHGWLLMSLVLGVASITAMLTGGEWEIGSVVFFVSLVGVEVSALREDRAKERIDG